MMESEAVKHTAGPWKINLANNMNEPYRVIVYGGARRIALCYKSDNAVYVERGEAEANAELIAKAPDLLREVTELRRALKELEGGFWETQFHKAEIKIAELQRVNADLADQLDKCSDAHP